MRRPCWPTGGRRRRAGAAWIVEGASGPAAPSAWLTMGASPPARPLVGGMVSRRVTVNRCSTCSGAGPSGRWTSSSTPGADPPAGDRGGGGPGGRGATAGGPTPAPPSTWGPGPAPSASRSPPNGAPCRGVGHRPVAGRAGGGAGQPGRARPPGGRPCAWSRDRGSSRCPATSAAASTSSCRTPRTCLPTPPFPRPWPTGSPARPRARPHRLGGHRADRRRRSDLAGGRWRAGHRDRRRPRRRRARLALAAASVTPPSTRTSPDATGHSSLVGRFAAWTATRSTRSWPPSPAAGSWCSPPTRCTAWWPWPPIGRRPTTCSR